MPRKAKSNRGGVRAGRPGTAYPNRSDLNTNKTVPQANFTGQAYGQATQQAQAQTATPRPPTFPPAGSLGDFARETERPDEPMTAGAPVGPGPGPEVLPFQPDDISLRLRAAFRAHPTEELRGLIEELDAAEGLA